MVGACVAIAGVAAAHAVLASRLRVPIIYGDELGYIENARFMALGGLRPLQTYYPGLSLLLMPAWWFTTHALTVWRFAQGVNALAATVAFVEMVALGAQCGLGRGARWIVALAVAAYPPMLLYSDLALSETLFQAIFCGLVLLVVIAIKRSERGLRAPGIWALIGVGGMALSLVHPIGYAVCVALVVCFLLAMRPLRAHGEQLVELLGGLVFGMALVRLMTVWTRAVNPQGRPDYAPASVTARANQVSGLVQGVFGRLFYASFATAGLVPLCVVVAVIVIVRRRTAFEPAAVFTSLAAIGVTGLSVLATNNGMRVDQLIHGRYLDAVVAPMLIVALAYVARGGRRPGGWVLAGSVTLLVSGAALVALVPSSRFNGTLGTVNSINILGLQPFVRFTLHPGLIVAIGVGAIVLLGLISWRYPVASASVLAVAFVVSAVVTQRDYFEAGSSARAGLTVAVDTVQDASAELGVPAQCVSYDGALDSEYMSDRLLLGTQPLELMGSTPCGSFVITTKPAFEERFPGSALVVEENDIAEDLYVLAGPTQDALRAAGWLLPNRTPGPVPLTGQSAIIRTTAAPPSHLRPGASRSIEVRLTNNGHVTPWPAVWGTKSTPYSVRLAVRWFPAGATVASPGEPGVPLIDTRVDLPRSLMPGQSLTMTIPLIARLANGHALPSGRYQVRVVGYQELNGSFAGTLNFTVVVS